MSNLDYSIVTASIRHIKPMSARLRADAVMTLQGFGYEPRRALHRIFRNSFYCRTAILDGRPVAMWGVAGSLLDETAYVWLVLAQDIVRFPLAIVREARGELKAIMENYRSVATTVVPQDAAAVRFAVFLGFNGGQRDPDSHRREIEREILENPGYRIPIGDQYVISLQYEPAGTS